MGKVKILNIYLYWYEASSIIWAFDSGYKIAQNSSNLISTSQSKFVHVLRIGKAFAKLIFRLQFNSMK